MSNEVDLAGLGVNCEIIGSSVGDSNNLDPAIADVGFGIPAVAGVVGHFIGPVLAEPNAVRVQTHLGEVQVHSAHEVGQRLVVDDSGIDSLAQGHVGEA